MAKIAAKFRNMAIEMGGVMIKVGQFLSSRFDVLPIEVIDQLKDLQDEVPPVAFIEIQKIIEAELGNPLSSVFEYFNPIPLAAASLGQVHQAILLTPHKDSSDDRQNDIVDVVVKTQRPDIEAIIRTDLAALGTVSNWLNKYKPIRKRVDIYSLLDEFSRILYEEIDYLHEGENAEVFKLNFSGNPEVCVPTVIWEQTTKRVLTLENVMSIKITDYTAISAAGIDRKEVAVRLLNTYLKQIFEDGFFHADPHPGNLFVNPNHLQGDTESGSKNWQLTFVDFGMAAKVPPKLKLGLRELIIGIGTKDIKRVTQSFKTIGVLLPGADEELLEKAGMQVFDQLWGKNMSELSNISPEEIIQFINQFRELLYTLPFQVPQDIIFLGRAVGILSGMCTGLDPEFNVWDQIEPFARNIILEETVRSPRLVLNELESFFRAAFTLPTQMSGTLEKINRGDISVSSPKLVREVHNLTTAIKFVGFSILIAALLLAGIQMYLNNEFWFGISFMVFAGLIFIWQIVLNSRKNGG
jgi:predicted unusual protein kinase regulating ubiquinone biosynthesis (AarF/ABC1/UbiB family)